VTTTGSRFQKLALTHALIVAGDAAMVVALADSFFFDVDPNGARSKVLAFLLVSFAPFLLVAPFIGPAIDRVRGGRRMIVQGVAFARVVAQILMVAFGDGFALFPLVFVSLVLQKTYSVSRAALVPSVVRDDGELVEANSKLGVIAGVVSTIAVLPAGLLQLVIGSRATFVYGALVFVAAFVASLRLPTEVAPRVITTTVRVDGEQPPPPGTMGFTAPTLTLAAAGMMILRGSVGFMLFHLAFWYRTLDNGDVLLGAAVAAGSIGVFCGNSLGPRIRGVLHEERMLTMALAFPAVAGLMGALWGGTAAGIVVAVAANFGGAIGRLAFDSLVQRDGAAVNRGQAFARFETGFQLTWVIAAVLPVLIEMPGRLGLALVGLVGAASVTNYRFGLHADTRSGTVGRARAG